MREPEHGVPNGDKKRGNGTGSDAAGAEAVGETRPQRRERGSAAATIHPISQSTDCCGGGRVLGLDPAEVVEPRRGARAGDSTGPLGGQGQR